MLAEMYLYGTNISQKMKIMRCTGTKKRRVQGLTEAQHQTAMYAQGTGTKIDNKQAWMWLTIAGNNNP
ncbi:hypothetical protein ACNKHM_25335 [Shigella sonnei]